MREKKKILMKYKIGSGKLNRIKEVAIWIQDYTALVLTIIGAINWGLIGLFKFDLVAFVFGDMTVMSRIVYAIVGIAGLYLISVFGRIRGFGQA